MPPSPFLVPLARLIKPPAIVIAVLLASLVLREVWRTAAGRQDRSPSLDARFAAFLPFLAGERRIGFVSVADDPGAVATPRVEIQYALAPVVVVTGVADVRLVVGWADRPERIDALAATHGLKALVRTADGFAILERTGP